MQTLDVGFRSSHSPHCALAWKYRFWNLDGPVVRITTPHIPLPASDAMEDLAMPTVDRIVETVRRTIA